MWLKEWIEGIRIDCIPKRPNCHCLNLLVWMLAEVYSAYSRPDFQFVLPET